MFLKNIKSVAILFITYLIFPDVSGTLFQWITKIDMNIDYEIRLVETDKRKLVIK